MQMGSSEEMQAFAATFALEIKPHSDHATLITLSGELGAGKTTFVQGVAKTFGVGDAVTSPTFVIEKIYRLQGQKFEHLVHIDAYRLESPHELEMLGWEELVADPGNLILLEWPERVTELLPKGAMNMRFDIAGEKRTISIDGNAEEGSKQ